MTKALRTLGLAVLAMTVAISPLAVRHAIAADRPVHGLHLPSAEDMERYGELVRKVSAEEGVPERIAWTIMSVESGMHRNAVGGPNLGLMQMQLHAARSLGFVGTRHEFMAPENNVRYGIRYLAAAWRAAGQLEGNRLCRAASIYSTGNARHVNRGYCRKARWVFSQGW